MPAKLTIQEAEQRCTDMAKGQSWRGVLEKYKFNCRYHGIYRQHFKSHCKGHGCPDCGNIKRGAATRLTIQQAEQRFHDMVKGQRWRGACEKYKFNCPDHSTYLQRFDNHCNGQRCPECGRIKTGAAHQITIEEAELRHLDMVKGQRWRGVLEKYKFNCLDHGIYSQVFNNHGKGQSCPECGRLKKTSNIDEYNLELSKVDPFIKVKPGAIYKNSSTHILHMCLKNRAHPDWSALPANTLRGTGCPTCSNNWKGEKTVAKYLDSCGIFYEPQKYFDTCKNKRSLPFDFYIPSQNILIEYQGEQHYKPTKRFGGKIGFKDRQRKDRIKKGWAKKNGYRLIEISYQIKLKNIPEYLSNILDIPFQKAA